MTYFVYIIKSLKTDRYYTGLTKNLERRLKEHDKGRRSTRTTLNQGPFRLIYKEKCNNLREARKREKFWKSGEGRELRKHMENIGV